MVGLGLQINLQKSTLIPVQKLEFIGAYLSSLKVTASLPQQHFTALCNLIFTAVNSPQILAKTCLELLGHVSNNICRQTHQDTYALPAGLALYCLRPKQI